MKRIRRHSLLAMLLAVLMVIGMLPAVTQEAYASPKQVEGLKDYFDGLYEGKVVIGSTLSVNVNVAVQADKEMEAAFKTYGKAEYVLIYHPEKPLYFETANGNSFTLKVPDDPAYVGQYYYLMIDIGGTQYHTAFVEVISNENSFYVDNDVMTAKVKYSKLKKKSQKLARYQVISFIDEGQGDITYKLSSAKKKGKSYKKYFKINASTGKVTVKKGLKKGTYTVKVKVKAGGTEYFKSAQQTVTFKVKVK